MICAGGDFPSGRFFLAGDRVCPYQRKDKQKTGEAEDFCLSGRFLFGF